MRKILVSLSYNDLESRISIDDFLNWHGINKLFNRYTMIMFPRSRFNSYGDSLFYAVLRNRIFPESEDLLKKHLYDFHKIGTILINTPTPWFKESILNPPVVHRFIINDILRRNPRKVRALQDDFINDPNALFGAFALTGIILEKLEYKDQDLIKKILLSRVPFIDYINTILQSWNDETRSINELSKLNFTTEQQNLILKWIHKEITLLKRSINDK